MAIPLSAPDFIKLSQDVPVIDVRTPAEFDKGHIPGATNIPLFQDHEHASVGTSYKYQGRRAAILHGLDIVGPNLRALAERMAYYARDNTLLIHCWRGGMRSQSMAWLASLNGYKTYILEGGYKGFRQLILSVFSIPTNLIVLGGFSGSGKTAILHALARDAQQVVDLEGLAQHKGSAFGGIGQPPQPTQQQFANQLGLHWYRLDRTRPVWIENENRQLGTLRMPEALKQRMEQAPVVVLDVPFELRVECLVTEYGPHGAAQLEAAIRQISRRLGGLHTQQALSALASGDLHTCCALLLKHYYDTTYNSCLSHKGSEHIHRLRLDSPDAAENAKTVLHSGVLESVTSTTARR